MERRPCADYPKGLSFFEVALCTINPSAVWRDTDWQRRLTEEGTTFQAQLNHTRELLGRHYLGNAEMRTDEIAYLLGYAGLNSFLRAFSTWTGIARASTAAG